MGFSLPTSETVWKEAAIVFAIDMGCKFAVSMMPLHSSLSFFPDAKGVGWLIIRHEENCNGGGGLPRLPFFIYLILLFGVLSIAGDDRPGSGVALGGVIGNLTSFFIGAAASIAPTIPMLFLLPPTGCVTDFIQVGAPILGEAVGVGAPVFNTADVFIFTGALMILSPTFANAKYLAFAVAPLVLMGWGVLLHSIRRVFTGA